MLPRSLVPRFASIVSFTQVLALGGCSLALDLDERQCTDHSDCSIDGAMQCVGGTCEQALTTSNPTTTTETSTSSTSGGTATADTSGTTAFVTTSATSDDTTSASETGLGDEGTTSTTGTSAADPSEGTGESSSTGAAESSTGSPEPPPDPVELITNHGFEDGVDEWTRFGYPNVFAPSTAYAHSGEQSAFIDGRNNAFDSVQPTLAGAVVTNVSYDVSAWVRFEDGAEPSMMSLTLKWRCLEEEDPHYQQIAAATADATGWTELAGSFIIGTGCDVWSVSLYLEGGANDGPPSDLGSDTDMGTGTGSGSGTGAGSGEADDGGEATIYYVAFYLDDVYATPRL